MIALARNQQDAPISSPQAAAQRMLPRFTVGGSHFLPEMVCLALLDRQRLIEVPVNYRVRVGTSKITGSMQTATRVRPELAYSSAEACFSGRAAHFPRPSLRAAASKLS